MCGITYKILQNYIQNYTEIYKKYTELYKIYKNYTKLPTKFYRITYKII